MSMETRSKPREANINKGEKTVALSESAHTALAMFSEKVASFPSPRALICLFPPVPCFTEI
eukprot:CAMPEP_0177643344 /NCGR_PEP_ID=MMETSP0447-20121125/8106_1 /TAXON_ID=0 /ORGANISM="Stygamoeba regulata, Strain BSH-02190019" /LENGTH=60 /DNA_ID=CAMNT_0019145635 /DNA_START=347 /DNA_END=529 /DNA_ORIENTATION=+